MWNRYNYRKEHLERADAVWLTANVQGELAGFASLVFPTEEEKIMGKPSRGILDSLFVAPTHIGSGVGIALWNEMVRIAQQKKLEWIELTADPHAERWYQNRGCTTKSRSLDKLPGDETRTVPEMKYIVKQVQ